MTVDTERIERKKDSTAKGILLITLCLSSLAWGSYAPVLIEDFKNLDPNPLNNRTLKCGVTSYDAVVYNDKLLFFAYGIDGPMALWCTTGAQSGTFKLKDLPSTNSRIGTIPYHIAPSPTTHGAVFFLHNACTQNVELWRTDGTASGTQCFKKIEGDIPQGLRYSSIVSEGVAFFWLHAGNNEFALWRTEGTAETTCCVAYVNIDGTVTPSDDPLMSTLQPINEPISMYHFLTRGTPETTLYAAGTYPCMLPNGTIIGAELDEKAQRARLLSLSKDKNRLSVYKSFYSSDPLILPRKPICSNDDKKLPYSCNTTMFFIKGREIWSTDGTNRGTRKENTLADTFLPLYLFDEGEHLYIYAAWKELCFVIYNKSSKEIVIKETPIPNDSKGFQQPPLDYDAYAMANGTLLSLDTIYFIESGTHEISVLDQEAYGDRLVMLHDQWHIWHKEMIGNVSYTAWWRTDGTRAGSHKLVDTCSVTELADLGRGNAEMTVMDNGLWLKTPDEETWFVPNESDEVQPLGHPLSDEFFGSIPTQGNFRLNISPQGLVACDNDGRNARLLLKNASLTEAMLPHVILCAGDYCFYHNTPQRKTYRFDGTPEGTIEILPSNGLQARRLAQIGEQIVIVENSQILTMDLLGENIHTIYTFPAGTHFRMDLTGFLYSCLWNEKLYFLTETSSNETSSHALWVTDGTAAGTHKIVDIPTANQLTATDSQLILCTEGHSPSEGALFGLWRSDGTTEGTYEVIPTVLSKIAIPIHPLNEYALFLAMDKNDDVQMWRTDGTTAGTIPITNIDRGPCKSSLDMSTGLNVRNLTATFNNRFYFRLPGRPVLFESDGTVEGTHGVHRFWGHNGDIFLHANEENLFYHGVDTDHNHTLWKLGLDSDGDGISDKMEGQSDLDNDGKLNYMDDDCDDDGIADAVEGFADFDQDGIINALDRDSDGDGIDDAVEGSLDSDGDGIPNYLDADSDQDGVPDRYESILDPDGDGIPDYLDTDSDGNGVDDFEETQHDTDGDGIPDTLDNDIDGDGISNETEGDADPDNDGIPNYLDTDSDGDGASDQTEWQLGADPYDGVSNLPLNPWLLFLALLFLLFILIPKNSRSKDA